MTDLWANADNPGGIAEHEFDWWVQSQRDIARDILKLRQLPTFKFKLDGQEYVGRKQERVSIKDCDDCLFIACLMSDQYRTIQAQNLVDDVRATHGPVFALLANVRAIEFLT